ncbi:MAG: metallophosphoesterase, partial [Gammaproteobacteria bacterium]|nr:metallophosphoesterase [Gammaproteobacteria bacterium]
HATWDDAALGLLAACAGPVAAVYEAYAKRVGELIRRAGLDERAGADWRAHGHRLKDPHSKPPLLAGLARVDLLYQMGNPVRILTSGVEAIAAEPFFASGKWRMLDRVKWWQGYRHAKPVLVGHYWRWPTSALRKAYSRGEHDLFEGAPPEVWLGRGGNVFCLDFGVGARYKERAEGRTRDFCTRLGALRWPERQLVFDDGRSLPVTHPAPAPVA